MADIVSILIVGFSVLSAVTLLVTYAFFMSYSNKTWFSLTSCAALMSALAGIQYFHLLYFINRSEPLASPYYRFWLFVVPSVFYFFGRSVIVPNAPVRPYMLIHLLPILLVFVVRLEISLPILFMFGTGYSIWLGNIIYRLREERKQFRFEFAYFAMLSAIAITVLILGFSIPYIDASYFYYFYSNAIGLAFVIVVAALIAIPDLIGDISEAASIKYSASTLADLDTDAYLQKLDTLMKSPTVYQNETLSLSSLAAELEISSHQLSELVNSRLGMGFSRYVRSQRVEAAKKLLLAAPNQSVLSIGIDTGFRSQSNFYTAFKEVTGQSPGDYRKARTR